MNKELKRIINETLNETFKDSPEKMEERNAEEVYRDTCPICKKQINEHDEYTEDGGVTWRHSDCKGLIARPETPLDEVSRWLRPYVKESRAQRHSARKALGMETISRGFAPNDQTSQSDLPPSGEKKYNKQEPEGPMAAVNTSGLEEASSKSERDEQQPIASQDYAKFMEGAVRVVNTTNIPISVSITEFTSNVNGAVAKAYIIHVQDSGPSK